MRFLIPLLFWAVLSVRAAAPTVEQLRAAADAYLAKQPVTNIAPGFSLDEAYKAQRVYVDAISPKLGRPAGHKIGLITQAAQERLGAKGPARGTLLKKMLLKNGARVSPNQGARPALEIDIGVTVKDAGINDATSLEGVVRHLDSLVCFIELVDSLVPTNQPVDLAVVAALNVGARSGVLGKKRKMTPELAAALPNMKMTLLNAEGKVVAEVPRLWLQPLGNVVWLVSELKKEGRPLKKGDFISLGSPAAAQPIVPRETITLRYDNLPGGSLSAKVRFTGK